MFAECPLWGPAGGRMDKAKFLATEQKMTTWWEQPGSFCSLLQFIAMENKRGLHINQPFKEQQALFTSTFPQLLALLGACLVWTSHFKSTSAMHSLKMNDLSGEPWGHLYCYSEGRVNFILRMSVKGQSSQGVFSQSALSVGHRPLQLDFDKWAMKNYRLKSFQSLISFNSNS